MIGAALYLIRRSLVNATRRRVARLRQPKYLIGFVVGGLYLYWLVIRPRRGTGLGGVASPNGEVVAVGLLGALVLFNWLFGSAESPFTFNLAETQYLFTAPLTRRQVIDFKLLRSQVPLFISAAVSALIFSGGHVSGLSLIRVVGLWLVYGTLQLHYAGMSLLRASLAQQGVTGVRRRLGSLLVLASLLAVTWWSVRRALPNVVAAFGEDPQRGYAALASIMHTGPLGVLVWPLEAVVAPLLAPSAAAFASRVPAALLVFGAHYIWVCVPRSRSRKPRWSTPPSWRAGSRRSARGGGRRGRAAHRSRPAASACDSRRPGGRASPSSGRTRSGPPAT